MREPDADAMAPFAPGPLLRLTRGDLHVDIAPQAGGRIAQVTRRGSAQLAGYDPGTAADATGTDGAAGAARGTMIGWGCYPMLPWAGRIRGGRFDFAGRRRQLPPNLGAHAIHGLGFALPWAVQAQDEQAIELSLALPCDRRWPFGGRAWQRVELDADGLLLRLAVQAGAAAMPVTIGWHPWFRKPRQLAFTPAAMYSRDQDGIATLPLVAPSPPPWDDCFVNHRPVLLHHASQRLTLRSDCSHWVIYDQRPDATCVEPQSGPPDAFNLAPSVVPAGETLTRWFRMSWEDC